MLTYEEQLNRDLSWALLEGSKFFERRGAVHHTLRRLTERLNELDIDYAIANDMAMFLHGYRRFTEDVDVLVTREGLDRIHEELEGRGYIKLFEKSKNLRDTQTGVKIDFLISGHFPGDGKPGPVAFPVPSEAAIEVEGIRFLDLVPLIELKLSSGRAEHRTHDLGDVQKLIAAIDLSRDFSEKLDPSLCEAYLKRWDTAQISRREEF